MSDMREELDRLRRDVDQLLARFPDSEPREQPARSNTEIINDACVRHLKESMQREGKSRGIAILRVGVVVSENGTGVNSGLITSTDPEDFRKPVKLRPGVAAMATDLLAVRAVRKMVEQFLEGKSLEMSRTELAAALEVSEEELEHSLRPLVADDMMRWYKKADGEEAYEMQNAEPHLLLLQSFA